MADPSREVYVMVGDGSYLMMSSEIVTSVQEGIKINHRRAGQSRLLQHRRTVAGRSGRDGFGTDYRYRTETGATDGEYVPVDFVRYAQGYGANTVRARTREELEGALATRCKDEKRTTAVVIEVDKESACRATNPGGTCRSRKSPRSRAFAPLARSTSRSSQRSGTSK